MTLVDAPSPSASGSGTGGSAGLGPIDSRRGRAPVGPASLAREAAGTTLWILAACMIGFAVWFAFLSRLYYDRAQSDAYANFRVELALAVAPVGPTQPFDPSQLLAPGTPVAVLNIPEIGLNAVVFEGTSGQVLEQGPGHLRYTAMPGQVGISVIFGRRTAFGGPFSRLPALHIGDTFSVTTGQGVSHYRVIDQRRANDPRPPLPTAGQGQLIMTTADGPKLAPSGVVSVDANLISKANPAPSMPLTNASMAAGEQPLGTDTGAFLPLALWGGALLILVGALSWLKHRWGRWQTWIVAVPVIGFFSLTIADQAARLLPNLM